MQARMGQLLIIINLTLFVDLIFSGTAVNAGTDITVSLTIQILTGRHVEFIPQTL
jgi:hypothetical protein